MGNLNVSELRLLSNSTITTKSFLNYSTLLEADAGSFPCYTAPIEGKLSTRSIAAFALQILMLNSDLSLRSDFLCLAVQITCLNGACLNMLRTYSRAQLTINDVALRTAFTEVNTAAAVGASLSGLLANLSTFKRRRQRVKILTLSLARAIAVDAVSEFGRNFIENRSVTITPYNTPNTNGV